MKNFYCLKTSARVINWIILITRLTFLFKLHVKKKRSSLWCLYAKTPDNFYRLEELIPGARGNTAKSFVADDSRERRSRRNNKVATISARWYCRAWSRFLCVLLYCNTQRKEYRKIYCSFFIVTRVIYSLFFPPVQVARVFSGKCVGKNLSFTTSLEKWETGVILPAQFRLRYAL